MEEEKEIIIKYMKNKKEIKTNGFNGKEETSQDKFLYEILKNISLCKHVLSFLAVCSIVQEKEREANATIDRSCVLSMDALLERVF